ncbi:MAG: hypothetical protein RR327_02870 [Clostridia bacterium]
MEFIKGIYEKFKGLEKKTQIAIGAIAVVIVILLLILLFSGGGGGSSEFSEVAGTYEIEGTTSTYSYFLTSGTIVLRKDGTAKITLYGAKRNEFLDDSIEVDYDISKMDNYILVEFVDSNINCVFAEIKGKVLIYDNEVKFIKR